MEPSRQLRVLLLADDHRGHAPTLLEHVDSLVRFSTHDVRVYNPRGIRRSRALDLREFDAVAIHYSLMALSEHYLPSDIRDAIAGFEGLKLQFVQDDYRRVQEMWAMMRTLGIDVLFTLVPERELERVWPERELPGVRKVTTLAGYVPAAAAAFASPPLDQRPLDVGYRGRVLPPWVGRLGQEKAWIAQGFLARADDHQLRYDVAWTENARIYGKSWFEFIASCRATLGTESGATITDFDGSIEAAVVQYQHTHPGADFEEIHAHVLAPHEGNVRMNVISPRVFEAVALRTGLVLFPGEYSGVLEPERHYILLEKDFSNFDEVVGAIRDTRSLEQRIDRAYDEIVATGRYSYRQLAASFDAALDDAGASARGGSPPVRYRLARVERRLRAASVTRPRSATRRLARAAAAARMILADRTARRALRTYALSSKARRATPPGSLLADLLRVVYLRRARARRLRAGPMFEIAAARDEAAAVTRIRSLSRTPARLRGEAASPADLPSLPLIWSHDAIAAWFPVPLTRYWWASFAVGVAGGAEHEFGALRALSDASPDLVAELLDPLLEPPAAFDVADQALQAPEPLPLPVHLLRYAPHYVRKTVHVAALLAGRRDLRELLRAALRQRDSTVPRRTVVADVVKLGVAQLAGAGEVVGAEGVSVHIADGILRLRSERLLADRHPVLPEVDGAVSIEWDHSAVGVIAEVRTRFGTVPYGLLPGGIHTFTSIEPVLREHRDAALRLLEPLFQRPSR